MKICIRTGLLTLSLFISVFTPAQSLSQSYLLYINQYHSIAERQQTEHGIPASIILAQGLLESGAGQSELSRMSNNHFGIKCSDWAGDKVYYDDDTKNECFRKYDKVLDSYEDHAMFLKNRQRYAFLFDLKPTDYEGWAFGLKKAGYATDPAYAFKLISIIENYGLHNYDLGKPVTLAMNNNSVKTESKATKGSARNDYYGSMGTISAYDSHEVLKVNRIRCVISKPGDTYSTIADEFNLSENKIREYNEVSQSQELYPGTRVYLSMKKRKGPRENLYHTVREGESMHSIAQDFGIKTENLYKLNNIDFSRGAQLGQVLKLR